MERLNIEATLSTPLIRFDPEKYVLELAGESYPENSFEFYEPVFAFLKDTLAQSRSFRLEVNIRYMNSSSTKCVLDMLDLLEEASTRNVQVEIVWYYDSENPRALDLAEEFQEEVTLPFSIMPIEG